MPATRLNVDALYTESLDTKLRWFYSQLALLSTDKRIRIILNRRTVLHDITPRFRDADTRRHGEADRLQFNGEVRVVWRMRRSRESMREDSRVNGWRCW